MWNLAFGNWSHAEGGNIHQLRELQVTAAANSTSVQIINDQWCNPGIYVGDVLYYSGDYAQITAYNEDTQTLTLNKALSTKALNSTIVHLFCGAIGMGSHAEGLSCRAIGDYSHAQNIKTIALGRGQTVIGRSNIPDTESAFIIGGGNKNIYQIDWDGNSAQTGSLQIGSYFILGDESYGYDLPETGVENQLFFQAVAGNELTTGNYEEYLPLDFIIHDTIAPNQSVNEIQVPSKLQVFDLEDFSLYADGLLLTQGLYYYFDTNYQTYFDFYLKPDVVLEYVINTSENKEEMDKILGRMGF